MSKNQHEKDMVEGLQKILLAAEASGLPAEMAQEMRTLVTAIAYHSERVDEFEEAEDVAGVINAIKAMSTDMARLQKLIEQMNRIQWNGRSA